MKTVYATILTLLLAWLLQLILPWWVIFIAPVPAILIFKLSLRLALWAGLTGVFLSWFVFGYVVSATNNHIFAERLGELFGGMSPFVYIFVSSLFAGILGMIGAFTGWTLRPILEKTKTENELS